MILTTILVEDNTKIRDTLVPAMEKLAGLQVVAIAETAREAVAAMTVHPDWRVLVVDMFLKEGSGLEVLQATQNRKPGKKILVLTNYATQQIRKRCAALGADGVFDKSTEIDDFFDFCASLSGLG
jgi:DNA-binding NarL/FixJ family response regulator